MTNDRDKQGFRYRLISTRMYADEKIRRLSRPKPNGLSLFHYLITGPHCTIIPGLFSIGEATLAEQLGWSLPGFRKAFAELVREGLIRVDWSAKLLFLPNSLKHNLPSAPSVITGWRTVWQELPECQLKRDAQARFQAVLQEHKGKASVAAYLAMLADAQRPIIRARRAPKDPEEGTLPERQDQPEQGTLPQEEGPPEEGTLPGRHQDQDQDQDQDQVRTFEDPGTEREQASFTSGATVPARPAFAGRPDLKTFASDQPPKIGFSAPSKPPQHTVGRTESYAMSDPDPLSTDPAERAAAFVVTYAKLYPKHRFGTLYRGRGQMDYFNASKLVGTWPNARLELMAVIFLMTDERFAASGSRTIGQFAEQAEWCDARLRENGR